jgi:gas vesicle protein
MDKEQSNRDSTGREDAMKRRSSLAPFAFGFTVGIVAGLIAAILSAPKSGSETRGFTRTTIDSKIDSLKGMVKEATADRKKVYTETWKQPTPKPYEETLDHPE